MPENYLISQKIRPQKTSVRTGMKVVCFVRFESTGNLRVGFSSKHSNTIFSFHLFRSWGPWMMLFFTTRFAGEHGEHGGQHVGKECREPLNSPQFAAFPSVIPQMRYSLPEAHRHGFGKLG
jgi:hypothetical protein